MMDTETYRQSLLQRREELRAMAQTGRETDGTVELDQSKVGHLSRMDALQAQAISLQRLKFDPAVTRCIRCASRREKE